MKKAVFLVTLLLTSAVFAYTDYKLGGQYDCEGNEIGTGNVFKCTLTIKKTGETYASMAICDNGNAYTGTGIYDANTHFLSSGFINPKKLDETGIAMSHVKRDGSMESTWTYINKTTIARTRCIPHEKAK
ncbi:MULTISPECIES: hypothetical protein [Legionella]|uniref:C-type lysozyme inhibitor domain-containing protein n=1 Tax=Legionella septentrionalis TaxID=2498109 RepID=A0A3S0VNF8_9GAMM|nr:MULTISPECIES: hypothetical protein [Legionella]MCP0914863.1 hypothetical protein [Legionella sp. 27cVA30]RUQ88812.1 hypothetical protein EKM59_04560 [Legionella septentrionalis]RUR02926.1 hypothetical protein ELY11_00800 [Legionella septentrionalis]RUR16790.1 hypothetical protein ELY10_02625 [Legionella septentrionalis]